MPLQRTTSLQKTRLARKPTTLAKKPIKRVQGKLKPKKKAKSKAWKFVKTALDECDSAFSKEIIARDGHCQFPGCQKTTDLTNSHYIGRANWNTRFDPENCIALCIRHHFMDRDTAYEFQKARADIHGWDGQYTKWMKKWLTPQGFDELLRRSTGKLTRKDSIIETQKKYKLRQPVDSENFAAKP